jgi:hypothetical protein
MLCASRRRAPMRSGVLAAAPLEKTRGSAQLVYGMPESGDARPPLQRCHTAGAPRTRGSLRALQMGAHQLLFLERIRPTPPSTPACRWWPRGIAVPEGSSMRCCGAAAGPHTGLAAGDGSNATAGGDGPTPNGWWRDGSRRPDSRCHATRRQPTASDDRVNSLRADQTVISDLGGGRLRPGRWASWPW